MTSQSTPEQAPEAAPESAPEAAPEPASMPAPDPAAVPAPSDSPSETPRSPIKSVAPARILAVALMVGIFFDLLFHGTYVGLSFLLFVSCVVLALMALGRVERVRPELGNLWLVIALIALAAFVAVRANEVATFLNVVGALGLLMLVAYFYAGDKLAELPLLGYPIVALRAVVQSIARPPQLIRSGLDTNAIHRRGTSSFGPVLRGLLLALPVIVVFAALLASADLMFAKYLRDFLNLDFLEDLAEYGRRMLVVLMVAWVVAGALSFALWHRRKRRPREGVDGPTRDEAERSGTFSDTSFFGLSVGSTVSDLRLPARLGHVESAIVLTSVVLLFGAFVWIQYSYLFGGASNIAAQGYTYAQYARRGFFELVTVALASLVLVMGLKAVTARDDARQERLFNLLGTIVTALVLVLLASAFYRLVLYEEAYGYTELRILAHVFMVWLGLVFAWFALTLWAAPRKFAVGAFVCAIGFVITLNVISPDAMIARLNLQRYEDTGKLDAYYLAVLSDDAVPTLVAGLDILKGREREQVEENLERRWLEMEESDRWTQWQSYHLGHQRAYESLRSLYGESAAEESDPPRLQTPVSSPGSPARNRP